MSKRDRSRSKKRINVDELRNREQRAKAEVEPETILARTHNYRVLLSRDGAMFTTVRGLDPEDAIDVAKQMMPHQTIYGVTPEPEVSYRDERPMPKMFKVKIYRRDSETPVEYENCKHVWRDNRGCVIVAQFTNPPDPEHHYFTWPLELISHYRTERQN